MCQMWLMSFRSNISDLTGGIEFVHSAMNLLACNTWNKEIGSSWIQPVHDDPMDVDHSCSKSVSRSIYRYASIRNVLAVLLKFKRITSREFWQRFTLTERSLPLCGKSDIDEKRSVMNAHASLSQCRGWTLRNNWWSLPALKANICCRQIYEMRCKSCRHFK